MITPEALLRMDSIEALKAMVVESLNGDFKKEWVEIKDISPIPGEVTLTEATTFFNAAYAPLAAVAFEPFTFRYHRLSLDFFQGVDLSVKYQSNATAEDIFKQFAGKWNIPVNVHDVEYQTYPSFGSILIQAAARSPRWIGSILLNGSEYLPEIDKFITTNSMAFPFDAMFTSVEFRRLVARFLNDVHRYRLPYPIMPSMFLPDVTSIERLASDIEPFNTKITLQFQSGFSGDLDVIYSRRSFPKTYRFPVKMSGSRNITPESFVNKLSSILGVQILVSDVDFQLPETLSTSGGTVFHVPFKESSLTFVGEVWVEYHLTS